MKSGSMRRFYELIKAKRDANAAPVGHLTRIMCRDVEDAYGQPSVGKRIL
jgi:hypothetical protein